MESLANLFIECRSTEQTKQVRIASISLEFFAHFSSFVFNASINQGTPSSTKTCLVRVSSFLHSWPTILKAFIRTSVFCSFFKRLLILFTIPNFNKPTLPLLDSLDKTNKFLIAVIIEHFLLLSLVQLDVILTKQAVFLYLWDQTTNIAYHLCRLLHIFQAVRKHNNDGIML
ncbi:hypothetical protein AGLY_001981 [Aphis glycines]|uniref:Uncharacterized protein n=1 Tax=Aphis glycines TaxID=307491 RepID=A0A6G0U4H3_APHGL|nr:hypothetical protein AGLY_001981 [Aphis glycines]